MSKSTALIALLLALCFFGIAQQNQPDPKNKPGTSTAAASDNPVKPTAESLAQGKKYYGYDCAMCHGENGDGKGEVAVAEKYNLKDFRDPESLKSYTDRQIFNLLSNGKDHMPLEPVRVTPNELWNLVNYVRSMAIPAEKK